MASELPAASSDFASVALLRSVFNYAALLTGDAATAAGYRAAAETLRQLQDKAATGTLDAGTLQAGWQAATASFKNTGGLPQNDSFAEVNKVYLAFAMDAGEELQRRAADVTPSANGLGGFIGLLRRKDKDLGGGTLGKIARSVQELMAQTAQGSFGADGDGKPHTLDTAWITLMTPYDDLNMQAAMSDGSLGIHLQGINQWLTQHAKGLKTQLALRHDAAQLGIVKQTQRPVYTPALQHIVAAPQTAQFRRRATP